MTVFDHLYMPSLGRATELLDSEPLGPAEQGPHEETKERTRAIDGCDTWTSRSRFVV